MKQKPIIILICLILMTIPACKKSNPDTVPGRNKLSLIDKIINEACFYLNNGNYDLAELRFQQALKKDPTITRALNGLGIIYLNRRQFDEAENQFKKLLQINPQYIDAYNQLGIISIEKKDYDKAKQYLLTAANAQKYRTPENAYFNLANLEMRRGRVDAALRYVDKGIKTNKFFAPLYNVKGMILENKKKYEDALYNYKKSLTLLEEENVFYLINVGRIHGLMGHKNEALDALERAMVKAPTAPIRNQIQALIKQLEKK